MIISTDALLHKDYHITPITPDNPQIYEYTLGIQNMYEILVPTCSYRMGTAKIGYGFAIIGKLKKTVPPTHTEKKKKTFFLKKTTNLDLRYYGLRPDLNTWPFT